MNAILTVAFIGMVVGFFLLFGLSPMVEYNIADQ